MSAARALRLAFVWAGLLATLDGCDLLTGDEGSGGAGGGASTNWAEPVTLVDGLASPGALAQTISLLVWSDDAGRIEAVTKDGGERAVVAETYGRAAELAVDGDSVYALDPTTGRLWSVMLEMGPPTLLAMALSSPRRLAFDVASLYWLEDSGELVRILRTGGVPAVLTTRVGPLGDLAVDEQAAYFTDLGSGTIDALPWLGGMVEQVVSYHPDIGPIAVDGGILYWIAGGALYALDRSETDAEPVELCAPVGQPERLVAAGGYVYWAAPETGHILRAPKSGGAFEIVATGQSSPGAVVIDSLAVYWLDRGSAGQGGAAGAIRMAKRL